MENTGYPVLDKLPNYHKEKIDAISDERGNGDGFWIYLKTPFCNVEKEPKGGMHIIHEDSPSKCLRQLRRADTCQCNDCSKPKNVLTHPLPTQ